jgi:hypothetical protein
MEHEKYLLKNFSRNVDRPTLGVSIIEPHQPVRELHIMSTQFVRATNKLNSKIVGNFDTDFPVSVVEAIIEVEGGTFTPG